MLKNETAALGVGSEPRPEEKVLRESTPPSSAAQGHVGVIRVWRLTRRPFRDGRRGADLPAAAFDRLNSFLQSADYVLMLGADGRGLALADARYFERLRRAAHGFAPILDPLDLDDEWSAEDDAVAGRAA